MNSCPGAEKKTNGGTVIKSLGGTVINDVYQEVRGDSDGGDWLRHAVI